MKILEVRYLGSCKDKGRGSQAFGWINGSFSAIFAESVLREWFGDSVETPDAPQTLYAVLGMKQTDKDPKPFYRRMAMQWHPDQCREPNAHEMFLRIQNAYELLSNSGKRARYDAGLKMEASINPAKKPTKIKATPDAPVVTYRAPLKCGLLMVEGSESGKWFVVSKILAWEDICIGNKTLVASWPMGANQPVEVWA
jgi:hypothetical protein